MRTKESILLKYSAEFFPPVHESNRVGCVRYSGVESRVEEERGVKGMGGCAWTDVRAFEIAFEPNFGCWLCLRCTAQSLWNVCEREAFCSAKSLNKEYYHSDVDGTENRRL